MATGSDKHYERWLDFDSLWILVGLIAIVITVAAIDSDATCDDMHDRMTTTEEHATGTAHGAH